MPRPDPPLAGSHVAAPRRRTSIRRRLLAAFVFLALIMQQGYAATLPVVLRHPRLTICSLLVVIAANVWMYVVVPKGFFPQQDTGVIMLLILKPGVDVASLCQRLEQSVPVLARPQAEVAAELRAAARARRGEQWRSKRGDSGAATRGFSSGSRGDKRNILGISQRKLEVRAMDYHLLKTLETLIPPDKPYFSDYF